MKLVFAGTPEPAVIALQALLDSEHEVVAVLTRPDARKGRGRTLHPSPVKELAQQHNIEVLTPETLRADSPDGQHVRQRLAELSPDAIPVVAYGNLVPTDLLQAATHGWVNLHFSLLPRWRGAAPVQAAIAAGDEITGATTFRIEEGLDTGPILGTLTDTIRTTDTAGVLLERLAHSGAQLLVETMDALENDSLQAIPQEGEASYAAKITTDDARIDWTQPAFIIDRQVRAYSPAPGAWTTMGDSRVKIGQVRSLQEQFTEPIPTLAPGEVHIAKKFVAVGTGTAPLIVEQLQPTGKKMMHAPDWGRGQNTENKVNFS